MIVILDVDGVVFRGQFLTRMSREVGRPLWVRVAALCALFELGIASLDRLLKTAYRPWKGRKESDLFDLYRGMEVTPGVSETISELHRRGNRVVLLSSGVPDSIVNDLAKRLGADRGMGLSPGVEDGLLTGEVGGTLSRADGKVAAAADLIRGYGADWKDVAVVADDRNNVALFEKSALGIGFNPTPALHLVADASVQGLDLRLVLPHLCNDLPAAPESWRAARELPRKLIHSCALTTPLAAGRWPVMTAAVLLLVCGCYAISEALRHKRIALFPFYWVTALTIRSNEEKAAVAPLYLGAAVLAVLFLFPAPLSYAAIGAAALSDPAAGLVGSLMPVARLPYSRRKSLGGLCAGCIGGILGAALYGPWDVAVVAGLAAAIVELLPLGDADNFWPALAAGAAAKWIV